MPPIITLTTDFGLQDEYVGVMKGILAAQAPHAQLIDLCHAVGNQNITQASFLLQAAAPYFPEGTIHLAVVDPGVGTTRELLILQALGQYFVAPDNGLLTPFLADDKFLAATYIDCPHLYGTPLSTTFHGRDILAPVAAALARGIEPCRLGKKAPRINLKNLSLPQLQIDPIHGNILGFVIHIDHFGNLITNIHQRDLAALQSADSAIEILCKDTRIKGLSSTYGAVSKEKILALVGSRGYVEVAANQGSAATLLQAAVGEPIQVICQEGK